MARKKSQKPTIKTIAQMCNVSTQTVSRVINKRPDVAPETREAVEKVIAETGYRPSALARSLVQQRSYTIGVIIARLKYGGIAQTLNGIAEESESAGYSLIVNELPRYDTPNSVPVIESQIAHHVEGIIFAAPDLNESVKIVQSQLPANCPPIIFLKSQPNPQFSTISIDNYGGARTAVEYLLSTGRRQIGFISGPLTWLESRQRKQGWEDALRSAGLNPAGDQMVEGDWSSASGEAAFTKLIQNYPHIDAVFTASDQMALGVLHYANARGIHVPDDLAVIGFDDLADAPYYTPSLSSVTHPLRELGAMAVKTLLKQSARDSSEVSHQALVLETHLVLRDSTPRAGG